MVNLGKNKASVYLTDFLPDGALKLSNVSPRSIKWLRSHNIDVIVCEDLNLRDFHFNDGHLNEKGYQKIKTYAVKTLD
jgi:exonuclease III